MILRILLCSQLSLLPALADALAGAWEAFPTEASAADWSVYAYGDDLTEPPFWTAGEDGNPYVFCEFIGGEGLWFFADGATAGGRLVGDYAAQKIAAIDVAVSVDPIEIDSIDLAVRAVGPGGVQFYFSGIYTAEDLGPEPGWVPLRFPFDDLWYEVDANGDFLPFIPDQDFLASITEIGVRVFPVAGVPADSFVGIDDVILVPTVAAPALEPSASDGFFSLEFTPNPGVAAAIEARNPSTGAWQVIPGQQDLLGPQLFATPTGPGSGLFRVVTAERLTPVSGR